MGASARLRIEALNLHNPNAAIYPWRLHFQRPQQILALAKFILRKIVRPHRMIDMQYAVDLRFQSTAHRRREAFEFEIESRVPGANLYAGNPTGVLPQSDCVEDVQHSVVPHQRQSPFAIEMEFGLLADDTRRRRRVEHVPEDIVRLRRDRNRFCQTRARCPPRLQFGPRRQNKGRRANKDVLSG